MESANFFEAQPSTVDALFALEVADTNSEMDYVHALEAYIDYQIEKDHKIKQKIRPALNLIRFLTLTPKEIAESSLLTAEEVRSLIICLTSVGSLVPTGFSEDRETRISFLYGPGPNA